MKPDINSLVNSVDPDQLASLLNSVDTEASSQGSTVFNATCELVIINQNMKYRMVLSLHICTCPRKSKYFQLVLNETGPGRTSRA